jgi:hypothetical protein
MVGNMLSNGLLLVQLFAALALGKSTSTPLYKDASAPVEKRVKDLLGRMTIEDKMSQLIQGASSFLRLMIILVLKVLTLMLNRRCHELDEFNIGRVQLHWSGGEHGNEGRDVLWYEHTVAGVNSS